MLLDASRRLIRYSKDSGALLVTGATTITGAQRFNGNSVLAKTATSGSFVLETRTATITATAASTAVSTNFFKANEVVLGFSALITTVFTADTGETMTVGFETGGDVDLFGTGIVYAAGTTVTFADYTAALPYSSGAEYDLVLTCNAGNFIAGGVMSCSALILTSVAPTA